MNKKCYLCGSPVISKHFYKLGYLILKCPKCSLFSLDFTSNYVNFQKSYYQKGYFTGNKTIRAYADYAGDRNNIRKNASKILSKIKKSPQQNILLDIGCAMGFFMEEAQNQGFNPFGVEVSEYAGNIAKKKFRERIYLDSVENFLAKWPQILVLGNQKFNSIVMSDIIEHLNDPRKVLIDLKKTMAKDGIVVIQTGDKDSLWARLMGKNWHFYAPPQHLFFFSKKTLALMLKQAGYEILSIDYRGKHVSLRYLLHMIQYMNIPDIGDNIESWLKKSKLAEISFPVKLFDNMIVYARKID